MSGTFKSNGNLKKLQKNMNDLSNTQAVPLTEIMNESFIAACSKFSSLEELIEASGFKVESKEDFEAIPNDEWEAFICSNTSYESWLEMQQCAGAEFTKAQLLKGLK